MPVINSIAELKDEMAQWRHDLHRNPQTCYEEEFAAGLIAKKLTEWGIPFKDRIAETGIVATIKGQKTDSGKALAFRADMDALNMQEKTGLPYASVNDGKMHACGHDGHTATLLGAAKHLNETRNFDGTIHLVFQPAEEGGNGAHKMITEGLFRDFPCDYIFGLHNYPEVSAGKIAMRIGAIMASVDEFEIKIEGKGGHAAWPHDTIDPIVIAAQIVTALQTIVSRNVDPIDTMVLSITNLNTGTGAFNVLPDTAIMTGTVRTFKNETREIAKKRITEICSSIASGFGAQAHVDYQYTTDPTINTADGVEIAVAAASQVVGVENVDTDCPPVMGGEDFGAFLMEKPGAFIFVGQGTDDGDCHHSQGLHSPHYDFNDEILPIGASWFSKLAEHYMPLEK